MNILYDHTVFRMQRYGGISRYFCELTTRLSKTEEVHLFKGININEYSLERFKEQFASYKSYKMPEIKYSGAFTNIINKILFDKEYSRMDHGVYHPTYYRGDIGDYTKLPIVLTCHDMIYELFPDDFWNSKSVIQSKKASIERADAIICISESSKKDLMRFYDIPEDKISIIHMGCSIPAVTDTVYNAERPYLLYVGDRSATYKNFWAFFETYNRYFAALCNLILFGNGLSTREQAFVKTHKLTGRVVQIQGGDDLLSAVYTGAICLVYPSLYEGFGIPVLEAMRTGCPVVASNTSSIPEVVGDAGILFDPLSEQDMVDAIYRATDRRSQLISAGHEREKLFGWDKMVKETMNVYQRVGT